jgi:hypothetical protein
MHFTGFEYVAIYLLVTLAGVIDSIAGGGGLITIPTYIAFGVPNAFILGINKFVATTGTSFAVFRYIRNKKVIWNMVWATSIAAILGSIVGAKLSAILSNQWMVYLLLMIIPVVFFFNQFYLKKKSLHSQHPIPLSTANMIFRSILIGLVIGCYDGFFGPATGTFFLIAYVYLLNNTLPEASANGRIVNYASNIGAVISFLVAGRVVFHLVTAIAALGFITGNWIGSGLAIRKEAAIIKPVFNVVLILLLAKCVYDVVIK